MEINAVFDRSRVISAAASMFLLISVVSSPMYPKTANADGLVLRPRGGVYKEK